MATANGDVRRRTAAASTPKDTPNPTSPTTPSSKTSSTSSSYVLLEALRALAGLALVSAITSYLLTSGQSYVFGLSNPSALPQWASSTHLRRYFNGPLTLTPSTLSLHDGSDPSKPIYLSLNRTIYDVSRSPHIYGPGGMYGFFSGRDASRAFITGCFQPNVDLVPYLDNVEEIYVPLWLSRRDDAGVKEEWDEVLAATGAGAVAGGRSAGDLIQDVRTRLGPEKVEAMREEAYAAGRERVQTTLATWAKMLDGKGYPVVGHLSEASEAEDPVKASAPTLPICKEALKNRPGMTESLTKAMAAMVKDGKLDIGKMAKEYAAAEGKAASAEGMAGADPRAREAIKEQIQRGHAHAQKERDAPAAPGHGPDGLPPHGAHNPHGAANPHGGAANPHAHVGANPHAGVPAHHMAAGAANPHAANAHAQQQEREQLKRGTVLGHAEAGDAAEAVGGVPPGVGGKARA